MGGALWLAVGGADSGAGKTGDGQPEGHSRFPKPTLVEEFPECGVALFLRLPIGIVVKPSARISEARFSELS